MATIPARAPLVLIISEHEWASRSLDTVLAPRGYAVLRAYNAEQGMARAPVADPDIVFIDRTLPDTRGTDLCREFVTQQIVSPATALILMAPGPIGRDHRVEAMRNGAWEVVSLPADAEELLLRVEKYVRAKVAMDRAREDALIDAATGLYTRAGLTRRIRELGAAAERFGRPLTCVVFTAGEEETGEPGMADLTRLAEELRGVTRRSDVLGRVGPAAFLVLMPDTPPEAAANLAERLRKRTGEMVGGGEAVARVQVHTLENLSDPSVEPIERLMRMGRRGDNAVGLN